MPKQRIALVVVLLIIIIGFVALNVFILLKRQKRAQPSEELAKEEMLKFAQEMWKNPEQPMQSLPVEEPEIPEEAIRITVSAENGFLPAVFEVEQGKEIILSLINKDKDEGHILTFKHETLSKVGIGVGPGETKVITFYAPQEAGEYEFYCPMIGHKAGGERGKMLVK